MKALIMFKEAQILQNIQLLLNETILFVFKHR